MFGKRTLKNIMNILTTNLIKFVATHNITLYKLISNLFFAQYYLKEKLRGRNSSKIAVGYDKEKESLFAIDKSTQERLYFIIPSRVLSFKKGLRVKYHQLFKHYHLGMIPFENNDLVVDIGANIGEISRSLKLLDLEIKYMAIEPSEAEFKALELNCSNSELHNIGCWDEDKTIDFYISSESADSSFIHPSSKVENIKKKTVRRLDTLVSKKIKLLKIDAEGGEFEVLKGCHEILSSIAYISVDVDFEKGKNNESTLIEVNKYLHENNFELIAIGRQRLITLYKNKNFIT